MPISVFGYINCKSTGASLDLRYSLSLSLSSSLSVSVYGYIICNSACIGTSLDSCFILSHYVWMCLPVSGYTITHCRSLDPSFSEGFYSAITIETDCTCIRTSLDPPFSLSLFLCLSQHPGILSVICMYVNKCDQLTQRVIALKIYLFDFACIRTFLDSYFFLFVSECV